LLIGVFFRLRQAIRITFAVFEFQCISSNHFSTDLIASFRIKQLIETISRRNTIMKITFRANIQILGQIRVVQNRLAGAAFTPQAFWHYFLFTRFFSLDLWRDNVLKPAHL